MAGKRGKRKNKTRKNKNAQNNQLSRPMVNVARGSGNATNTLSRGGGASRAGSRLSRSRAMGMNVPNGFMEEVCGTYDAFCEAANGAKLNDRFPVKTVTYQSRSLLNITSGTTGNAILCVAPDLTSANYFGNNASGAITLPASFSASDSKLTTWLAFCGNVRIVSAGVRFIPQQSMSSAQGIMTIGEVPSPGGLLAGSYTYGSELSQFDGLHIMGTAKEFVWAAKPRSELATQLATVTASSTVRTGFWPALFIEITGYANSTVVGTCEVVINYEAELVLSTGSTLAATASTTASSVPSSVWESAMQIMRKKTKSIFEGGVDLFGKYAIRSAMTAVSGAIATAFPSTRAPLMLANYAAARNVD